MGTSWYCFAIRPHYPPHPPHLDSTQRTRLGAWYTPPPVVAELCSLILDPIIATRGPLGLQITDPACGDGNFLIAARDRLVAAGLDAQTAESQLSGADVDPIAVEAAKSRLGSAEIVVADGLSWSPSRGCDVVLTNPPFLSQMRRRTARDAKSHRGSRYADTAALFLDRWASMVTTAIGAVMPLSFLAAHDSSKIRDRLSCLGKVVLGRVDPLAFDAAVHTVLVALTIGEADDLSGAPTWSPRIAPQFGFEVPAITPTSLRLGDIAHATADFRDQYYGLIEAVNDEGFGVPLITTGLITASGCQWGNRSVRFAKQTWARPSIDLDRLDSPMRKWAARRLVPKVLVATQTAGLRAIIDEEGRWLPSVPVITVMPKSGTSLATIQASITSPLASAWAHANYLGTALSPTAIKLSASQLLEIPVALGD